MYFVDTYIEYKYYLITFMRTNVMNSKHGFRRYSYYYRNRQNIELINV